MEAFAVTLQFDLFDKVRVQFGESSTFLLPFQKFAALCQKHLDKKLTFSPAVFKKGKGQNHGDVKYSLYRVIDLDTKGVATDKQLREVSKLFPNALVLRGNGIQVFLEAAQPSWKIDASGVPGKVKDSGLSWQVEAQLLAAMGKMAEKKTGLDYDDHHIANDGRAQNSENHLYRAPWGWADRAKLLRTMLIGLGH